MDSPSPWRYVFDAAKLVLSSAAAFLAIIGVMYLCVALICVSDGGAIIFATDKAALDGVMPAIDESEKGAYIIIQAQESSVDNAGQ